MVVVSCVREGSDVRWEVGGLCVVGYPWVVGGSQGRVWVGEC